MRKKSLFILSLSFFVSSCDFGVERKMNDFKNEEISGVIIEKYRDKWNHNHPMVKINNGSDIAIGDWETRGSDYLWPYIEIGDSIIKRSGDFNLYIVKPSGKKKSFLFHK